MFREIRLLWWELCDVLFSDWTWYRARTGEWVLVEVERETDRGSIEFFEWRRLEHIVHPIADVKYPPGFVLGAGHEGRRPVEGAPRP